MSQFSKQILKFYSVSKSFGPKGIFSELMFSLNRGEKVALVGENGSGKTTFIRIALGLVPPDTGKVELGKEVTIGHLPQHMEPGFQNTSIGEYLSRSQVELARMKTMLEALEEKMSQASSWEQFGQEWDRLHTQFVAKGGYGLTERQDEVLHALNLEHLDPKRLIGSLSGGEKQRFALAALLIEKFDLLFLDEPTNHLDRKALTWLEKEISSYPGAIVLISHDREFLNKTAKGIYEIDGGSVSYFSGDYDNYVEEKEKKLKSLMEQYQKNQKERASLKYFLKEQTFSLPKPKPPKDRNILAYNRKNENIAQAKRTAINQAKEKLAAVDSAITGHPIPKQYTGILFHFQKLQSPYALQLENVVIKRENTLLHTSFSSVLHTGERVILKGPNGSGKTTLLHLIANEGKSTKGNIHFSKQAQIGYLPQDPIFYDETLNVIEYLRSKFSCEEHQIRSWIYRIQIIDEKTVGHKIESLSLGQKRRLQLLCLMLTPSNILLLDEPTNHLAPFVIEQLEKALLAYPGAIIAATHDRRFENKIGSSTWQLGTI